MHGWIAVDSDGEAWFFENRPIWERSKEWMPMSGNWDSWPGPLPPNIGCGSEAIRRVRLVPEMIEEERSFG